MKAITSATIVAAFIAIIGVQGRRHTSTVEQALDSVTSSGTATDTDTSASASVSPSISDKVLTTATDSSTADFRTDSDSLETSTDSESDAEATSTLDDANTDIWIDSGFTPVPSMIASQPLSIPPRLTPIAGPPATYASSSMFPAVTAATTGASLAKSKNAGSSVGMVSSEWLALSLIAAVAAILL